MKILGFKIEGLHLRLYFGLENLEIVVRVDGPLFWAHGSWLMWLLHCQITMKGSFEFF
jgi:hypothetical protein